MKYLLITLSLLLTACATTTLEKARIAKSALIVEQNFNTSYEAVSKLELNQKQLDNVNVITSAKQALDLVMSGKNLLSRLETASLLERHYAAAKTAYVELRSTIDKSKLNALEAYELERFDNAVVILSKQISKIAENDEFKDKKLIAYDVLEMLVLSLQIVELSK